MRRINNIKMLLFYRPILNIARLNFHIYLVLLVVITSCSGLIKVTPPFTSVNKDNVFENDATASSVLTNLYANLSSANISANGSISSLFLYSGLAADELKLFALDNSQYNTFYYNTLNENSETGFWSSSYSTIYSANMAIDGLTTSTKITSGVKQQLLGEAKFIRAFCYFYLVNLFGDVPLVTDTDPLKNATLSRSSIELVYSQIYNDLEDAKKLLSEDFRGANVLVGTSERVRPTKWAASALLARAYLYRGNYELSEKEANEVLQMSSLFSIDSLNAVFLKNSNECIWQLQTVSNSNGNTGEGNFFILPSTGPNTSTYPVYLSKFLINSFEENDQRKSHWIDSIMLADSSATYYYAYKYKSGALTPPNTYTEYEMVLRLGEQYLIRSEARAQLGNIAGAKEDLNVIRKRAGLGETVAENKDQLISAILHERQVELFTEWGHRWFDLKRTKTIDDVMNIVALDKGTTWSSNWALWPLYLPDISADHNLVQNEGY